MLDKNTFSERNEANNRNERKEKKAGFDKKKQKSIYTHLNNKRNNRGKINKRDINKILPTIFNVVSVSHIPQKHDGRPTTISFWHYFHQNLLFTVR
jgi:hypothetical protein